MSVWNDWAVAAVVSWGCQGASHLLWEGNVPIVGKWQVFQWED